MTPQGSTVTVETAPHWEHHVSTEQKEVLP
jgi:hypothetical protein